MKPNLKKRYTGLLTLLLLLFGTTASAKFTWTMPPVGPGHIGYELASSIMVGRITGTQAFHDARDSRNFNSPYGGKGKDMCYQFHILFPTVVVVDSYGSEVPYSHFDLMRLIPGGGVEDIGSDYVPQPPFIEELPDYYMTEQYLDMEVYTLQPGHYYLVHEGAYGNAGAYEGIYVVNLYAFTQSEGPHLGEFLSPIPIELECTDMYYTDMQPAETYLPTYNDVLLPDISYSLEVTQTSNLTITQPYESFCKSVFYLLNADNELLAESDDTDELIFRGIEPGYYTIVNKALLPKGRIGVNIVLQKDWEAPGVSADFPADLGVYKDSFTYSKEYDSKNHITEMCSVHYGPSEFFCKVKLLKNMAFTCTMTGSEMQKITILDPDGKQLYSVQDPGKYGTERTLILERDLPYGEYILKFETDGYSHPVVITVEGVFETTGAARNLLTLQKTENYTLTATPTVATKETNTLTRDQVRFDVAYTDGLGRVKQRIDIWGSGSNDDLVQAIVYDVAGRNDSITYLSYVSPNNSGLYRPASAQEQAAFYRTKFSGDADADHTFATKRYGAAGEVLEQTSVGETGTRHPILHEYRLNAANEVRRYRIVGPNGLVYTDYYPAGTLQVHATWQAGLPAEATVTNYEYTDARGQKIAVRARSASADEFTSSVYDEFGHLRYTVPAMIGDSLSINTIYRPEELAHYAFYYEYDHRGRRTEAWIPGAEPVYLLYDKLGRETMKQTGNQRAGSKNEWTFTKYDEAGRQIMTGTFTGGTRESHQAALRAQTVFGETRGSNIHGYTNRCYPTITSPNSVLSVTYYDDYDWMPANSACAFSADDRLDGTYTTAVMGQLTGSKSKVLGVDENRWLTTAVYYDDRYRIIESVAELYPGGVEVVSNKHDFTGNVIRTKVKQTIDSQRYEYNKWFDYDTSGRLLAVRQKITGDTRNDTVTVASYTYDELGHTSTKRIHNNAQTSSYAYRLGGVQTGMTSSSFSYALGFDRPVAGQTARYDGKMSDMVWGNGTAMTQGYRFTYDSKGQMTAALHAELDTNLWRGTASFNEDGITYDKNGNILTMHRSDSDGNALHDLIYHYSGNRLRSITQNGKESDVYTYDADGNMTYDGLRGVGIEYNVLNLPERIFAGNDEIRYIYSSNGTKLATVANGSFTYYRSVMVYGRSSAASGEEILYMLQPEGLATRNGSSEWTYKYFMKDHLNNTRVLLAATPSSAGVRLTPEQTTDYYAYGLAWSYDNLHRNRYLYNGKELQDASVGNLGLLGLYDFGARYYDPLLGRWFNIDPALQLINPYLFCGNCPIMFIDKDGEFFWLLVGIGAVFGAYMGGAAANDNWNPFQWDWTSGKTWGGLFGGAIQGAVAGASLGYGISAFTGPVFGGTFTGVGHALRYASFGISGLRAFTTGVSLINNFGNAMDIIRGNYAYGSGSFGGKILQGLSRATWERPQQVFGDTFSHARNGFGKVDVRYFNGAVVVNKNRSRTSEHKAVTLGNMINSWGIDDDDDAMLYHEYGHTIQSRFWGPLYLLGVGLPSAISAGSSSDQTHSNRWYERAANRYARNYFGEDVWDGKTGDQKFVDGTSKYPIY